jgi:6-pyruvoyltetrahydropterin/6-carboxytetrahydropterin synthase
MVHVTRVESFNAAHKLWNENWSEAKNAEIFGKCSNKNFHGHNYTLEVWIDGNIDPETGYVIDLKIVKDLIKSEIEERFDHRNLNLDCPEFADLIPTAENISVVCFNLLRTKLDSKYSLTIRLWETENNIVEYGGQ